MEEWVEYLKNGVISPDTQAPGLQEARKKLKYYSMSDAERYAYDEHIPFSFYLPHLQTFSNKSLHLSEEKRIFA